MKVMANYSPSRDLTEPQCWGGGGVPGTKPSPSSKAPKPLVLLKDLKKQLDREAKKKNLQFAYQQIIYGSLTRVHQNNFCKAT